LAVEMMRRIDFVMVRLEAGSSSWAALELSRIVDSQAFPQGLTIQPPSTKKISSVIEKSSIPKLFVRVWRDAAGQRDCVVVAEEARRTDKFEIRKRHKHKPQI